MTLHLIKLAVGVDDVDHLAELQARRLAQAGAENRAPVLRHVTRHAPRRAEELLTGGSLYWVIRGWVRVRQKLVGLDPVIGDGVRRCALVLDPLGSDRAEGAPPVSGMALSTRVEGATGYDRWGWRGRRS